MSTVLKIDLREGVRMAITIPLRAKLLRTVIIIIYAKKASVAGSLPTNS